jgi:prepilin-type N-terminal cleavage/methylation domain-containing protein
MLKKIRKKIQSQEGFTLLEILVVLTIMGFLIAMVAPRLASVGDDASETVCNTNKGRYRTYVSTFCNQNGGRFPDKLTNMVITDGSGAGYDAYVAPASDEDPETGKEVLAKGHNMMYKFMVHTLNSAEAGELEGLGISKVYNLNDYTGLDYSGKDNLSNHNKPGSNYPDNIATGDRNPYMDEMAIAAGAKVLMAGCGAAETTGNFTAVGPLPKMESKWAYRDLFARIIFSIGPESELVTSGIISNAAHCPGSIVKSDNFTYGEYYLVLPRLNSTISRFVDDNASLVAASGVTPALPTRTAAQLQSVVGIACDRTDTVASGYNVNTNNSNYRIETVNMLEEQEPWQFETSRLRDDPIWYFDFSGNNTIQVPSS